MEARRPSLGPNFTKLFSAATISNLGDGIMVAATPLLAASLTSDPRAIGAIVGAGSLPWLIFTLFSGAIVDRVDRRRLMWRVDLARAAVVAVIAVLVASDSAQLPLLAVSLFALGIGETLFDNATIAFLPHVVDGSALNRANGRLEAIGTVCNALVGPPLGAFLFVWQASAPFAIDAVSFAMSALLIARIRSASDEPDLIDAAPAGEPSRIVRTLFRDIREGIRFLVRHTLLRRLAASLGVWNLVANACGAMLIVLATREFGLSERGFGLLLAAAAIGGIAGGLLADRILNRIGSQRAVQVALTVSMLGYAAVPLFPHPVVLAMTMAIEGCAGTVWNVWTLTLRQELVPDRLLGRVTSAYRLVGVGTLPLGAVLGGFWVQAFGVTSPYWFAAAAIGALALLSFTSFFREEQPDQFGVG